MNKRISLLKLLHYYFVAVLLTVSISLPVRSQVQVGATDTNSYPFRNSDMPIEKRVNNIISLMTMDERSHFSSSFRELIA